MRSLPAAGALVALCLVLAGCMKADLDLTLRSDNRVDGEMVVALADSLAWAVPPQSEWEEEQDVPPGAVDEPYSEPGFIGIKRTFHRTPVAEVFNEPGGLTVTREGGEFVVSGAVDPTLDDSDMLSEVVGAGGRVSVAITFPGRVTEHNGSLDGRTVTWNLGPGEEFEFHARGNAAPGALATVGAFFLAALVAAALFAAVLLALFLRRRRDARGTGAPSPVPPAA